VTPSAPAQCAGSSGTLAGQLTEGVRQWAGREGILKQARVPFGRVLIS